MTTVPPSPAQGETAGVSGMQLEDSLLDQMIDIAEGDDGAWGIGWCYDIRLALHNLKTARQQLAELQQTINHLGPSCASLLDRAERAEQQLAEARADATLADERWMRDGERRDKAEQQLADSAHEVERLNAANAAMRELLIEARPIVFEDHMREMGTRLLTPYTLTARIDRALAAASPDPVRSAGEAVPERGKCELHRETYFETCPDCAQPERQGADPSQQPGLPVFMELMGHNSPPPTDDIVAGLPAGFYKVQRYEQTDGGMNNDATGRFVSWNDFNSLRSWAIAALSERGK